MAVHSCPGPPASTVGAGPAGHPPARPGEAGSAPPSSRPAADVGDPGGGAVSGPWTQQEPRPCGAARGSDLLVSVSTQSAPEGIRTPNLLIRSQMLYPLSYGRSPLSGLLRRNGR